MDAVESLISLPRRSTPSVLRNSTEIIFHAQFRRGTVDRYSVFVLQRISRRSGQVLLARRVALNVRGLTVGWKRGARNGLLKGYAELE